MDSEFSVFLQIPRQGLEPQFLGPKPSVLPLDDLGIQLIRYDASVAKSRLFFYITPRIDSPKKPLLSFGTFGI